MFTSKLQSAIGFEPLVMMTAKNGAPPAIIGNITNSQKKKKKFSIKIYNKNSNHNKSYLCS